MTGPPVQPQAQTPEPARFEDLSPIQQSQIRANVAQMRANNKSDEQVRDYLTNKEGLLPAGSPPPAPKQSALNSFGGGAAQGASFGFFPKMAAAEESARESLPTWLLGEGKPVSQIPQRYNKLLGQADAQNAAMSAQHKIPYVAGQVAGAIGGGGALGAGLKSVGVGNLIDQGMIGGGLAGAGYTRGSPDDYARNIVTGSAIGGILAPVADAIGSVAGGVGKRVLNATNLRPTNSSPLVPINSVSDEAKNLMLKKLSESGLTPQAAGAQIAESGKPMTATDLGVPMQRLARTVNASSPQAGAQLSAAFGPRQSNSVERVLGDIEAGANQSGQPSAHLTDQQLVAQRANDANNAYGAVFADKTPIADERIDKILATPAGKKAAANAGVMMANARLPMATEKAMRTLPTPLIGPDGQPLTVTGQTTVNAPTIQQLHYIKLAFDDLINGNSSEAGEGGLGFNQKKTVVGLKNDLLNVMREKSAGYDAARSQYADQSDLIDALREGADHFNRPPAQSADLMKSLSPPEQQLYVRGATSALRGKLESGSPARDVTAKVGENAPTVSQDQLRLLFPDEKSFDTWKGQIGNEARMAATNRTTFGGSPTADKMMDLAEFAGVTPSSVVSAMTGNPRGMLMGVARQAIKDRSLGYGQSLANQVSPFLTAGTKGPEEGAQAMQALTEYAKQQLARPKPNFGAIGGTVAGSLPPQQGRTP